MSAHTTPPGRPYVADPNLAALSPGTVADRLVSHFGNVEKAYEYATQIVDNRGVVALNDLYQATAELLRRRLVPVSQRRDQPESEADLVDTDGLTMREQAANFETCKHIREVGRLLHICIIDLLERTHHHDQSKLAHPEVGPLAVAPKLAGMTYQGAAYRQSCEGELKTALEHHYANNRHHPQHFKRGVDDMNLLDLLEMICDWKASSGRQHDGNLRKSIDSNIKRYEISQQLAEIMTRTAELLD